MNVTTTMKTRSCPNRALLLLLYVMLGLAGLLATSRAATLTANSSQGSGSCWTNVIWKTNSTGTAVGPPVPGNAYVYIPNSTPFGNNLGNARARNPVTNASVVCTFPGDSLTLTTNTEIRTKNITQPASLGAPTLNFPGAGGNPGLILNGGVLNVGDDGIPSFAGTIRVDGTSFICPGDNGAGYASVRPNRAVTISGQLSGTGDLVILQTPTNLA